MYGQHEHTQCFYGTFEQHIFVCFYLIYISNVSTPTWNLPIGPILYGRVWLRHSVTEYRVPVSRLSTRGSQRRLYFWTTQSGYRASGTAERKVQPSQFHVLFVTLLTKYRFLLVLFFYICIIAIPVAAEVKRLGEEDVFIFRIFTHRTNSLLHNLS